MGREIRRVPAGWEHPKESKLNYRTHQMEERYCPMYDEAFICAARQWMDAAIAWDNGSDPDTAEHKAEHPFYWQWDSNPPDPERYRPDWPEESLTHYQVYETVSEGTPVTPPFATEAELVDYLVQHGDYWDQKLTAEGTQPSAQWSRANAEAFVKRAWAPSLIISAGRVFNPQNMGELDA